MAEATSKSITRINDLSDTVSHALHKATALLTVMSEARGYCEENMAEALGYISSELHAAKKALEALTEAARS